MRSGQTQLQHKGRNLAQNVHVHHGSVGLATGSRLPHLPGLSYISYFPGISSKVQWLISQLEGIRTVGDVRTDVAHKLEMGFWANLSYAVRDFEQMDGSRQFRGLKSLTVPFKMCSVSWLPATARGYAMLCTSRGVRMQHSSAMSSDFRTSNNLSPPVCTLTNVTDV